MKTRPPFAAAHLEMGTGCVGVLFAIVVTEFTHCTLISVVLFMRMRTLFMLRMVRWVWIWWGERELMRVDRKIRNKDDKSVTFGDGEVEEEAARYTVIVGRGCVLVDDENGCASGAMFIDL